MSGMVEKRGLSYWMIHAGLILGVLLIFFPIWLAFVASTVSQAEIVKPPMPLWPGDQFFENYRRALVSGVNAPVAKMLLNSAVMAIGNRDRKDRHLPPVGVRHRLFPVSVPPTRLLADLPDADASSGSADCADLRGCRPIWHAEFVLRIDFSTDCLSDGDIPVQAVLHDRSGRIGRGGPRRRLPSNAFFSWTSCCP